jgi:hypothetical protein
MQCGAHNKRGLCELSLVKESEGQNKACDLLSRGSEESTVVTFQYSVK